VAVLSASNSALEQLSAVAIAARSIASQAPVQGLASAPAQFHQAMAEYGGCSAPLTAPAALPLGHVRHSNTCY
jgi:hypothetical protein